MALPADAPFRRNKTTPKDGYREGYKTGLTWNRNYRPGGPHVFSKSVAPYDPDWVEYCDRSARIHEQWLAGFDDGIAARDNSSSARQE